MTQLRVLGECAEEGIEHSVLCRVVTEAAVDKLPLAMLGYKTAVSQVIQMARHGRRNGMQDRGDLANGQGPSRSSATMRSRVGCARAFASWTVSWRGSMSMRHFVIFRNIRLTARAVNSGSSGADGPESRPCDGAAAGPPYCWRQASDRCRWDPAQCANWVRVGYTPRETTSPSTIISGRSSSPASATDRLSEGVRLAKASGSAGSTRKHRQAAGGLHPVQALLERVELAVVQNTYGPDDRGWDAANHNQRSHETPHDRGERGSSGSQQRGRAASRARSFIPCGDVETDFSRLSTTDRSVSGTSAASS